MNEFRETDNRNIIGSVSPEIKECVNSFMRANDILLQRLKNYKQEDKESKTY